MKKNIFFFFFSLDCSFFSVIKEEISCFCNNRLFLDFSDGSIIKIIPLLIKWILTVGSVVSKSNVSVMIGNSDQIIKNFFLLQDSWVHVHGLGRNLLHFLFLSSGFLLHGLLLFLCDCYEFLLILLSEQFVGMLAENNIIG